MDQEARSFERFSFYDVGFSGKILPFFHLQEMHLLGCV